MMRVIDHAASSEASISHRVADMMRRLSWDVNSDISDNQPLDACGYIAADATCALREAALTKSNSWFNVKLDNYASLDSVIRGNAYLGRNHEDRVLYSDDINLLVRRYSRINESKQAMPRDTIGYFVTIPRGRSDKA